MCECVLAQAGSSPSELLGGLFVSAHTLVALMVVVIANSCMKNLSMV